MTPEERREQAQAAWRSIRLQANALKNSADRCDLFAVMNAHDKITEELAKLEALRKENV